MIYTLLVNKDTIMIVSADTLGTAAQFARRKKLPDLEFDPELIELITTYEPFPKDDLGVIATIHGKKFTEKNR